MKIGDLVCWVPDGDVGIILWETLEEYDEPSCYAIHFVNSGMDCSIYLCDDRLELLNESGQPL